MAGRGTAAWRRPAAAGSARGGPEVNPLRLSGLVLAGANHHEIAASGAEDGILTAEEIATLDLGGTVWAVLSACDSGIGEVAVHEGVLGLRRAFLAAGVRTVITSLMAVADDSARRWMEALRRARLDRGETTAAAARAASLELLASRRAQGQEDAPWTWGAFLAVGDWR
jgi:CHAT domain-containing protein